MNPRSILVPLDGSAYAERVLPMVERLAAAARARLVLLRAVTQVQPGASHDALALRLAVANATSAVREAKRALWATTDELRGRGFEVGHVVARGDPAEVIVETAKSRRIDLIVMSTRPHSAVERVLLGSVADRVIQHNRTPVLVLPGNADVWPPSQPVNILVPLDGSAFAECALPAARALARLLEGDLQLLQVCDERTSADAEQYLQRVVARFAQPGQQAARLSVVTGAAPSAAILRVAREQEIGLIALATHGRGGVARAVLGSVASEIIARGTTPVLVVRPRAGTAIQHDWAHASPTT